MALRTHPQISDNPDSETAATRGHGCMHNGVNRKTLHPHLAYPAHRGQVNPPVNDGLAQALHGPARRPAHFRDPLPRAQRQLR